MLLTLCTCRFAGEKFANISKSGGKVVILTHTLRTRNSAFSLSSNTKDGVWQTLLQAVTCTSIFNFRELAIRESTCRQNKWLFSQQDNNSCPQKMVYLFEGGK